MQVPEQRARIRQPVAIALLVGALEFTRLFGTSLPIDESHFQGL